ncbi:MAG: hypothetical protein K9W44_14090 [Candidatus Lokiarchaeota archaeon]|nr:hypothetical protein [Candidatus Harpocratesius repetitus]
MLISTDLHPLKIDYPLSKNLPKNLIDTPYKEDFRASSKKIPFREQYANETRPHIIKHIHYQYGKIKQRNAILYFYNKKPIRLIYTKSKDPFVTKLMKNFPPKVKFPPNTASSPIARSLREIALKWIVEQFFNTLEYLTFDEPRLEEVNPDCLLLPMKEASKILYVSNKKNSSKHPNLAEIESERALFVEIKAYHQSTKVGEKEVLQTYNYSNKGGKALLITTGELDTLESLDFLNRNSIKNSGVSETYSKEVFTDFATQIKKKNKSYIKDIDMSTSQDSYDTRGIYISAHKKIKKMFRYTKSWPGKINYKILTSPLEILEFLTADCKLGLVEPQAFHKLLEQRNLQNAADLFNQIRSRYLEEIIIDPTVLYPRL